MEAPDTISPILTKEEAADSETAELNDSDLVSTVVPTRTQDKESYEVNYSSEVVTEDTIELEAKTPEENVTKSE